MRMLLSLAVAALVLGGCRSTPQAASAEASAAAADERLARLVEAYFEELLVLNPVRATMIGDHRYNSTPNFFVQLGSGKGAHPFKTVKDYEDFLARVEGFLAWNESAMARLREGMEAGIVLPRVLVERTLPQLAAHVVDRPEDSLFFLPVASFPEGMPEAERARLTEAWRATIRERLVPAYRRRHDFLRDEYLPRARAAVGLSVLPGGAEWYAHLVRETTTTELTPEALHELGLREVARIHGEMDAVLPPSVWRPARGGAEGLAI